MTSPFTPETRALIASYRQPDAQEQQRVDAAVAELRDAVLPSEDAMWAKLQGPDLGWMPSANENRAESYEPSAGLTGRVS